jgi:hypothetical protein
MYGNRDENARFVVIDCGHGRNTYYVVAPCGSPGTRTYSGVGYFDYTYKIVRAAETASYTMLDGVEDEVWTGDIEGTAQTIWRVGVYKDLPVEDVWLPSNFTGTLLGKYEGTMVILLVGDKPLLEEPTATQWYGEWLVVSGTGDLANVHGKGIWWETGFRPDNGIPDSYYAGEVIFMEPPSE